MASLTPGVLSKLVENTDSKVTGDHRSALLQVIGILPSLSSSSDHPPWRTTPRAFFLRVSDSLHSAYVSLSDRDSDLISAGQIQLGHFVYASRLDAASPVPILRGLKLVPGRRKPCPCLGDPVDLVSSDLLFAKKLPVVNGKELRRRSNNGGARAANEEGVEMRRLSLDSAKRACWDRRKRFGEETARRSGSRFVSKPVPVSVISDKEASPKNIPSVKHPNLNISPLKNKNNTVSPLLSKKPLKKELKSSSECTTPSRLVKVPLTCKTVSGQKISWDVLPPTITELGKQVVQQCNVAFLAAVRSLEEASAADGVIHCMCIFAEFCDSSQKCSAGALVQKFLDLNQKMQSAAMVVDALLNSRLLSADSTNDYSQQHLSPDLCKDPASKNAASWVKAAIATNLSAFDLFRKQNNDENPNSERCHYVVLENSPAEDLENRSPPSKQKKRNNGTLLLDSITKGLPPASGRPLLAARRSSTEKEALSKGSRLKEAASLAEKLLLASREWFMKYLEDSLKTQFGLKREEQSPEIASLLRQLKRVNHWLDELASNGAREDKRIEGLKKKLYGFLLEHVDAAVVKSH